MIFRLNSARVDAMTMKCLVNVGGDWHEIVILGGKYVYRCHNLGFRELPNVQIVERKHAFDIQYGRSDLFKRY
jgi:hypothetical protein